MSVDMFCRNLPSLPFGKNDRKWYPMWIRRYAGILKRGKTDTLPVDEPDVIRFSQSLRDHGVPAWQRLSNAIYIGVEQLSAGTRQRPVPVENTEPGANARRLIVQSRWH
jgi:hypothetical protein